jgi:hypothetical protein
MQAERFQEWPFLEDYEWVQRMNRLAGKPAIVPLSLATSPRRWHHYGAVQTTLLNQAILAGYACGIGVDKLYLFYTAARNKYVTRESRGG